MVRYIFTLAITTLLIQSIGAQDQGRLALTEAYLLLEDRYPSLQNGVILSQIYQGELEQLDIDQKPSIMLHGEGRLQSERIQLGGGASSPINIEQPLVNLRSYVETQYLLIDGGFNDAQRKLKEVKLKADLQEIEVDKFNLRNRVDVLFLNIELSREQIKLFDLSIADLTARKERIAAGVEQGILLESELTKLDVKSLEINSAKDDHISKLSGLINTLSDLIGVPIDYNTQFILPELNSISEVPNIVRPEQTYFDLQKEAIQAQSYLIDVDKKAKISAFAQAGIGYPNPLNLFDTGVAPYGIIGAKLQWKLTDWDKSKSQKNLLNLQCQKLDNAKATFEFNLNSKNAQYLSEVIRIQKQIANDGKIANLQTEILNQLGAQLDEGIITASDYVIQVNAELRARQNLIIHQKQLQKLQLEFWSERGGF